MKLELLANKFNILIVLLKIWVHVNEFRQSMFWIKIKKIMNTPVNPSFTKQKCGMRGHTVHGHESMLRTSMRELNV